MKSLLFDKASGSVGNVTVQNSAAGMIMRSKPSRVQKPTQAQLRFQNEVRNANLAWKNATPAQRLKFDNYAPTVPKVDSLGNLIQQSGWNVFNTIYQQIAVFSPKPDFILNELIRESGYSPPIYIEVLARLGRQQLTIYNNSPNFAQFSFFIGDNQTKTGNVFRGSYKFYRHIYLGSAQTKYLPYDIIRNQTYYFKIIDYPFPVGLAKPIYSQTIT